MYTTYKYLLLLLLSAQAFAESKDDELSDCLKKCILPLAQLERSFNYMFNHFESSCETLESGAFCVQKCSRDDQQKFHQYTTFYRIHCIDYEEDLEPHLGCLKNAAKDSDMVCQDRCHNKIPDTATKEEKQIGSCLSMECSTVCYYQEFTHECPEAADVLMKLNLGQIHSIAQTIHPISFERMDEQCRNIHNTDHMKRKMLGMDEL